MSTLAEIAYKDATIQHSAILEHLPVLRSLSSECRSVVELGVDRAVSTFAFLAGLPSGSFLYSVDVRLPPHDRLEKAIQVAKSQGIIFIFQLGSDLELDIPACDLMFIDTFHTYCQAITELRVLSGRVQKYIVLHDTSPPWGLVDEKYDGDYKPYPGANRRKQGIWTAVLDFLAENQQWVLKERKTNCYGLTILQRRSV